MDWLSLQKTLPTDSRLSARTQRLLALETVLDGRMYDALKHPFSAEVSPGGEYVPLTQRRPAVRTGLCRVAIEDAVSLLFSEGHWPGIKADAVTTTEVLMDLVKQTKLNEVMLEAATRGSVGSVAIRMRCLSNKPFFDVLTTPYLYPEWQPHDPDKLLCVTERMPLRGKQLVDMGYPIASDDMDATFWFQRVWDDKAENWFTPVRADLSDDDAIPKIDQSRSVQHALGFVPIVWVRNLASSGRAGPEGACAFEAAIDTVIEADYLLSQGGRALKYASDPKLVITAGAEVDSRPSGGAANALLLPTEGDAKLLEINGAAATAILEHVQHLRAIALENMHGNRTNADKLSAATSGRSIELMMTGLIWMADRLRTSYGEGALLDILKMVCAASEVLESGLSINGQMHKGIDPNGLQLRWAPWMPPMPHDLLETAQGLVTAASGNVLSRETASARMGDLLDVDDPTAEFARITAEMADAAEAADVRAKANAGKNDTRELTA